MSVDRQPMGADGAALPVDRQDRLAPRREPFAVGTDVVEENERRAKTRERLWGSAAVVASGLVAALATLRLLTISRFNISTALAILGAATPATIVFGAILTALPYVLAMAVSHLGNSATWAHPSDRRILWSRYSIGLVVVAFITPGTYILSALVPALFAFGNWAIKKRKRRVGRHQPPPPDTSWLRSKKPHEDKLLRHYRLEYEQTEAKMAELKEANALGGTLKAEFDERLLEIGRDGNQRLEQIKASSRQGLESITAATLLAFVPLMFHYISLVDRPWMPSEQIQTSRGAYAGYIVRQDAKWTTILKDSDRSIVQILSADVTSRAVCSLPRQKDDQRPLIFHLSSRSAATYPECTAAP